MASHIHRCNTLHLPHLRGAASRPAAHRPQGPIMPHPLNDAALDQLFRTARTYNAFSGDVSDATLRQLYDLLKFGPTQANTTPARFVFVKSAASSSGHVSWPDAASWMPAEPIRFSNPCSPP